MVPSSSRGGIRPSREAKWLVALRPRNAPIARPINDEHDRGENHGARSPCAEEGDRASAALETCRRAQVGRVPLGRSQPLDEIRVGRQLSEVAAELGDQVRRRVRHGKVSDRDVDAPEIVVRGHASTSLPSAPLIRVHVFVPASSCSVPLGVTA